MVELITSNLIAGLIFLAAVVNAMLLYRKAFADGNGGALSGAIGRTVLAASYLYVMLQKSIGPTTATVVRLGVAFMLFSELWMHLWLFLKRGRKE